MHPAPAACNGHPLFTLENIYRAYRRCRRRKRGTVNCLRFERRLEENLIALSGELNAGTYTPSRTVAFLVEKPKRREIFAADFRDRVVHHLLVDHLEPHWERRFIHDSYACRKGRGTHGAVERLRTFLRRATANGTRPAWYLQLDVRGFFITIDRQILLARLERRERDPVVRWLMRQILFTDPKDNCILRGHRLDEFLSLPAHKSLFHAGEGRGLPIGNLTSQFFANVYLDTLDQFVKHELKARWYVRYCDDFVLVDREPERLRQWEERIGAFLEKELRLALKRPWRRGGLSWRGARPGGRALPLTRRYPGISPGRLHGSRRSAAVVERSPFVR